MTKTKYIGFSEVNELQTVIIKFVIIWIREKKIPIPLKVIILEMENKGVKKSTIEKSIKILIKKGYIRRAYTISNKTTYVLLRTI